MSIGFDSNTDYCRINPAGAISHYAFTLIAKVRITSAAAGHVLSVYTNTTHWHSVRVDAAGTTFSINRNNSAATSDIATIALDTWHSVAICGWISGATRKLSGYVKTDAGALQKATVDNPQSNDTLTYISLGAGSSGNYPRGLLAYAKLYSRALSDSEIEAEMVAEAPVSETNLVSYTTGQGGNIGAAMTANTSNAAYADTWTAHDFSNSAGTTPTYSSDAPTWVSAGPTLSGSVQMVDTVPSTSIAVERFAINSGENAASVVATFAALPAVGRPLIAFVGGWMSSATAITLTDNRGGTWEQLGLAQRTGSSMWVGAWRSTMPAGSTETFAVTATPDVASGNWITLEVNEIVEAYQPGLIDVAFTDDEGSSDAPIVDLVSTRNSKTLILGAATYLSSANTSAAGAGWTTVAKKDGSAALVIIQRVAGTAGNYDPTWALTNSDSWLACGLALTADAPDVSGGVPPPLRRRR